MVLSPGGTSLTEATICLVLKTVRSIAISASVNNMLNKELKGYRIDKGQLWKHSVPSIVFRKFDFPLGSWQLTGNQVGFFVHFF